jgi:microcystin-dependent protein
MANQYIGEIRMVGFGFAPVGWALCNGALLAISQNAALFSLLGTTYGGNGTTTFALPDLRSRVPLHQGQGPGLSPYVLGELTGVENNTLLTNNMPIHNHVVNCNSTGGSQATPGGGLLAVESTGTSSNYTNAAADSTMNPTMLSNAGGSQPFSNIQPCLCVNFIIALVGIFPSRN